jgi:hypothetical protein
MDQLVAHLVGFPEIVCDDDVARMGAVSVGADTILYRWVNGLGVKCHIDLRRW